MLHKNQTRVARFWINARKYFFVIFTKLIPRRIFCIANILVLMVVRNFAARNKSFAPTSFCEYAALRKKDYLFIDWGDKSHDSVILASGFSLSHIHRRTGQQCMLITFFAVLSCKSGNHWIQIHELSARGDELCAICRARGDEIRAICWAKTPWQPETWQDLRYLFLRPKHVLDIFRRCPNKQHRQAEEKENIQWRKLKKTVGMAPQNFGYLLIVVEHVLNLLSVSRIHPLQRSLIAASTKGYPVVPRFQPQLWLSLYVHYSASSVAGIIMH